MDRTRVVRFAAHYGLSSDIELGPKSATTGLMHRSNWRLFDLRRHRDYSACTCTGAPRFPTVPGAITR